MKVFDVIGVLVKQSYDEVGSYLLTNLELVLEVQVFIYTIVEGCIVKDLYKKLPSFLAQQSNRFIGHGINA